MCVCVNSIYIYISTREVELFIEVFSALFDGLRRPVRNVAGRQSFRRQAAIDVSIGQCCLFGGFLLSDLHSVVRLDSVGQCRLDTLQERDSLPRFERCCLTWFSRLSTRQCLASLQWFAETVKRYFWFLTVSPDDRSHQKIGLI